MNDTTLRKPSLRRRVAIFLVSDALVLTLLLSSFATTESCVGITSVTGSVTYNSAPFRDTVVRTLTNVSGVPKSSDQKIGLRLPNGMTVSGISALENGATPIPLVDCPPAVRELETHFPSGAGDYWTAYQMPIVTLDPGEFVRLQYFVNNVTAPGTAHERATALDAEFTCAQSYSVTYPLQDPTPPMGGPSVSLAGRLALLLGLAGVGVLFLFRRVRLS